MPIRIDLRQLPEPLLEFGGPGEFSDMRQGLREAGPFDLRFGAGRNETITVGLVGPDMMIDATQRWLERCQQILPEASSDMTQYPAFPGFQDIFRAKLIQNTRFVKSLGGESGELANCLNLSDPKTRFEAVLELYAEGVRQLSSLETKKPDVVLCCLPDELIARCWSLNETLTKEDKAAVAALKKKQSDPQLSLSFDSQPVEEQPEDLLQRDFRRALKARAMRFRMPVQIATRHMVEDQESNQAPNIRAWNSTVALYYKAGGIPWRLNLDGPETCFVGVSFHHLRTTQRHLVQSSIAQAFSSKGEGFALRGGNVDWSEDQGRNVHLTDIQAAALATNVLEEYRDRTGGDPVRMVFHKTSAFSEAESEGFRHALTSVPVVELINIMPTQFRLLRFGSYPPNRGTLCLVNGSKSFLFTTGYMPSIGTYPGPHIPAPVELRSDRIIDLEQVAKDILGLARMNWNTASMSGGQPVTLAFSRKIGGIMAEYGEDDSTTPLSSFRYYM
ncbi:hypothetical protein EDE15_4576 [Edaphobacter aggregans]|uniref:Piwi domain-containing protein n=1 Tax=Edaphobacter aggregans TaxID=570835 RepID=A0A3R9P1H8_9BACT|nr:hypothetical protein [Edaphobacter aggregans]RSL18966.1 hypothetical protein EDE15_4576 [Edaphobacter aggregans]